MSFLHRIGSFLRFLFLLSLLALLVAAFLCLRVPQTLPSIPVDADQQAESFYKKIVFLEQSWKQQQSAEVGFTIAELNSVYFRDQSADLRMAFSGNQLTVFLIKKVYVMDVYIQTTGKITISHGRVLFSPTNDAAIGMVPVPLSLVNSTLQEKLHDPQMQELLHLPAYINSIKIRDNQLMLGTLPHGR